MLLIIQTNIFNLYLRYFISRRDKMMRNILFRKSSLTKNRFCLNLTFKSTCILITIYILLYAYINTFFFRAGVESIKRDKVLQYGAIGSNVERSRNH